MKALLFLLSLICFTQVAIGQTNCKDFKVGRFINWDENDMNTLVIERSETYQIETHRKTGAKVTMKVTWIDECTYRLTFVEGNEKWKAQNNWTDNADLIVTITETGKDYCIQVTKMDGRDDYEYRGKIKRINAR